MTAPIAVGQVWEHRRSGVRVTVVEQARDADDRGLAWRIRRLPDVPAVLIWEGALRSDYRLVGETDAATGRWVR